MTTTDKPKRRWYQFRSLTLLVLLTLFAVYCIWYAVDLRKRMEGESQRESSSSVEEEGSGDSP